MTDLLKLLHCIKRFALFSSAVFLTACSGGAGGGSSISTQPATPAQEAARVNGNLATGVRVLSVGDVKSAQIISDSQNEIVTSENSALAAVPVGQVAYLPAQRAGASPAFIKVVSKETLADGTIKLITSIPKPEEVLEAISWQNNTATQAQPRVVGIITPGSTKAYNPQAPSILNSIAHQTGLNIPGISLSTDGSLPVELKLDFKILRPKGGYREFATYKKMCSDNLYKRVDAEGLAKVAQYCEEAYNVVGTVKFDKGDVFNSLEAAKDSGNVSKYVMDESKPQKLAMENIKLAGDITLKALVRDGSLIDMLGIDGYTAMYDGLSGVGFGNKDSMIQGSVSGLSSSDKKSRIPLFGAVLSLGTASITPANAVSINLAAPAGVVVWVHAIADVTWDGQASVKLEIEPMVIDVGIERGQDGLWDTFFKAKTVATGSTNPKIIATTGYEGAATVQAGVGVDVDFLLANLRLANLRAEAKARGDVNGDITATYDFSTKELKADACARLGYGAGITVSGKLGIQADYRIRKRAGQVALNYELAYPEDETDPGDYPLFLYTKKPVIERCYSTQAPKPVFISAQADYAPDSILALQPLVQLKAKNESLGSLTSTSIKYKKRNFLDFGLPTEASFTSIDGEMPDLYLDKTAELLQFKNISGQPVAHALRMPEGDYYFRLEMQDYAGRKGISYGVGRIKLPSIYAENSAPAIWESVKFWLRDAITDVVQVVWRFAAGAADVGISITKGAADALDVAFLKLGVTQITAELKNAAGDVIRTISAEVQVGGIAAEITVAEDDSTPTPVPIARDATTADATPVLRGSIASALPSGYQVRIFKDGQADSWGTAVTTGLQWRFTPTAQQALASGIHSFTAKIVLAADGGTAAGLASAEYRFTVQNTAVTSALPAQATRTQAITIAFTGEGLPLSGLSVVAPGARNTCGAVQGVSASGFSVVCSLYTVGQQALQVWSGTSQIASFTTTVASNVTDVNWQSASTSGYGKATVKFGEMVTYRVSGSNLLADSSLGFAVQNCGLSNTEIGTASNTERSFQCWFNNQAGAVAGAMSGIVKDAPSGQQLFSFSVPLETAPIDVNASMGISWDLGAIGTAVQGKGTNPRTVAVNAGVEIEGFLANPAFDVDVSDTGVRLFNFRGYTGAPGSAVFDASAFNGLVLRKPSGASWQFSSASLGSGNTLAGLVASRISSQADRVAINLQGLSYDTASVVRVDFVKSTVSSGSSLLPATGVTANQCYQAGSNSLYSCNDAASLALNTQQDGHRAGINAMNYSLVPNVSGIAGLNYSKNECVKDNITGLIWEGKTADNGQRDYRKAYTNFGDASAGDASEYVRLVNQAWLCGKNDWRLPTAKELQTIVNYGVAVPGPTIDFNWFPNTAGNVYWSHSPTVGPGYVWSVSFYNGIVDVSNRSRYDYHVRLVR